MYLNILHRRALAKKYPCVPLCSNFARRAVLSSRPQFIGREPENESAIEEELLRKQFPGFDGSTTRGSSSNGGRGSSRGGGGGGSGSQGGSGRNGNSGSRGGLGSGGGGNSGGLGGGSGRTRGGATAGGGAGSSRRDDKGGATGTVREGAMSSSATTEMKWKKTDPRTFPPNFEPIHKETEPLAKRARPLFSLLTPHS